MKTKTPQEFAKYVRDIVLQNETEKPSEEAIALWGEANLGTLNISLDSCYTIKEEEGDIAFFNPFLSDEVTAIYGQMYLMSFLNKSISTILSGGIVNRASLVTEIKEGDSTIKMMSAAEILKHYRLLLEDARSVLKDLIDTYKYNNAKSLQVTGNDDIFGLF